MTTGKTTIWFNRKKPKSLKTYTDILTLEIMVCILLNCLVVGIGSSAISGSKRLKLDRNRDTNDSHPVFSKSNTQDPDLASLKVFNKVEGETSENKLSRRCGIQGNVASSAKHSSLTGHKWQSSNLSYQILNYPSSADDLSGGEQINAEIERAFRVWESVINLTFTRKVEGDVDIQLSFEQYEHGDGVENVFDRPPALLAYTNVYIKSGRPEICFAQVHFDDQTDWSQQSLLYVAVHEIAHSLGLGHSNVYGSVMWPSYNGYRHQFNVKLHSVDIRAIQNLYGEQTKDLSYSFYCIFIIVIIIAGISTKTLKIVFSRFLFTIISPIS